jgi:hypothetical protein
MTTKPARVVHFRRPTRTREIEPEVEIARLPSGGVGFELRVTPKTVTEVVPRHPPKAPGDPLAPVRPLRR